MITVQDNWERALDEPVRSHIEELFPAFLMSSRWFGGKAKTIRSAHLADTVKIGTENGAFLMAIIDVSYAQGEKNTYVVPIGAAFDAEAERLKRDHANAVIGDLSVTYAQGSQRGVLYDALWNPDCALALLASMGQEDRHKGSTGTLVGSATAQFADAAVRLDSSLISVMKGEQSNTSVKFGDRVIMKLYRRIEPGMNPELEIGRALTSRSFRNSPELVGALEYAREHEEPMTMALAQRFIANQGNAWDYTLSQLSSYFGRVGDLPQKDLANPSATVQRNRPSTDVFFGFIDAARLLGRRTGELHNALGEASADPAFAPESCSTSYLRQRIQAMQRSTTQAMALLRNRLSVLSASDRQQAETVLELEPAILERMESLNRAPLTAMRIRCHGDYHLGQVLYTGEDFIIIDYEGEPARPLAERRSKHLPIVDLAGMIRSFHYAAHVALRQRHEAGTATGLEPWAEQWYRSVRATFLAGYRAVAGTTPFSPRSEQEFDLLLDLHLLDKAIYELTYELNNRPDWVALPLMGIIQCMNSSTADGDTDARVKYKASACDPL